MSEISEPDAKTETAIGSQSEESFATLESLPVEMYVEIAGHTAPLELVCLAKTSNTLCRILTSRQWRVLWTAALDQLQVSGLPPCPKDLSPTAYLMLAVWPLCGGCSSGKIGFLDWDFRIRLCPKCIRRNITPFNEDHPPPFLADNSIKFRDVVRVRPPTPLGAAFLTSEVVSVKKLLERMSKTEQIVFLHQRKEAMVLARAHARDCREWEQKLEASIKAVRLSKISERLMSLGWADEVKIAGRCLDHHSLVKKAMELSDTEWDLIRPVLEDFMAEVRAEEVARQAGPILSFVNVSKRRRKQRRH
ncbi:hypothetical protein C8R47DRAFT_428257 [Mycena vitilis]|nr:hypothetical protein C8R47DRAFT_428257 [Mycena vitilis]